MEETNEQMEFNPYNPNNIEITLNDVQSILNTYGIPTKLFNFELYRRAFVHRSYTKKPRHENELLNITIAPQPPGTIALSTKSNERLEFLGDGVLELITKYYLYRRFPKENEGFMTEKKIAIVKNEAIGKMAYEMGLHKWLIISRHAEEKKIRTNLKKLGCLFEAFIGALFLDFNKISVHDEHNWFKNVFCTGPGFQMAQIFVEKVFEKHIDWAVLLTNDDNFKNILQVKIQKEFKVTPHYVEMKSDLEEGYKMGVYLCIGISIFEVRNTAPLLLKNYPSFEKIKGYLEKNEGQVFILLGEAEHRIKRKAEQQACQNCLKVLLD